MDSPSAAEFFEKEASEWDSRYERSPLFRRRYRVFSNAIAKYGYGTQRALDYGCGSGVLTQLLERTSKSVVAVDIAENMRRITRDKFQGSPNVEVTTSEALKPLDFDLVICSSVIEYVEQPLDLLKTLSGYIKSQGILLITFANRLAPLQLVNRYFLKRFKNESYATIQKNVFSAESIRRLSNEADLEILSLATPIGLPIFTLVRLGELHFLVARKRA